MLDAGQPLGAHGTPRGPFRISFYAGDDATFYGSNNATTAVAGNACGLDYLLLVCHFCGINLKALILRLLGRFVQG